jgi:23S rRNA pseudouridine1911/1915/1917 synthase
MHFSVVIKSIVYGFSLYLGGINVIQTRRFGDWFELILPPAWEGFSIEQILKDLWHSPKKQVHTMRMEKGVKVNGEIIPWTKPLQAGDKLQIKFFNDEEFGVIPAFIDIEVLYEDDHLIVLNKPAGMDTHPNTPDQANTLANALAFYLQSKGEFRKVKHVHRLDRDTTGAVLFAKHLLAGSILDRMLEERQIKRTYAAIVHGKLKTKKGTIKDPIGRDRHHPTRRRVSPAGQPAVTHYELLKSFAKENLSLVKCSLDTGRTHQIRVHLSSIGHPIAGDTLYGGKPIYKRQALHAAKLEIPHPFTGETITCIAKENSISHFNDLTL